MVISYDAYADTDPDTGVDIVHKIGPMMGTTFETVAHFLCNGFIVTGIPGNRPTGDVFTAVCRLIRIHHSPATVAVGYTDPPVLFAVLVDGEDSAGGSTVRSVMTPHDLQFFGAYRGDLVGDGSRVQKW